MRVDCENQDCTTHIEISDIVNVKSLAEFELALQELTEVEWDYVKDPLNIYFYCPEHKVVAKAGQAIIDAANRPRRYDELEG